MTKVNQNLKDPFGRIPWKDMFDIAFFLGNDLSSKKQSNQLQNNSKPIKTSAFSKFDENVKTLILSTLANPFQQINELQKNTGISCRQLEILKDYLITKGYFIEIAVGKSRFLVGKENIYNLLGLAFPYHKNVPLEHPYLILLAKNLLEANPLIDRIITEVRVKTCPAILDLLTVMKDGQRLGYEVVVKAIDNVCGHAVKIESFGLSQLVFLSRDYDIKQTVLAHIKNAGFAPNVLSKVHYVLFSQLIRQKKQLLMRK